LGLGRACGPRRGHGWASPWRAGAALGAGGNGAGSAVCAAPPRPVTRTLREQAPHASERQRLARQGCQHAQGSPQGWRTGLAHLYHLGPEQRRAPHAGQGGVEVDGGTVPTRDGCLTLQILTSGGWR
jgi:hypothetical protein